MKKRDLATLQRATLTLRKWKKDELTGESLEAVAGFARKYDVVFKRSQDDEDLFRVESGMLNTTGSLPQALRFLFQIALNDLVRAPEEEIPRPKKTMKGMRDRR